MDHAVANIRFLICEFQLVLGALLLGLLPLYVRRRSPHFQHRFLWLGLSATGFLLGAIFLELLRKTWGQPRAAQPVLLVNSLGFAAIALFVGGVLCFQREAERVRRHFLASGDPGSQEPPRTQESADAK